MTTAATSLTLRALFSRTATRLSLDQPLGVTAGLSHAAKALAAVSASRVTRGVTLLVVPTDKDVEQMTADARFFYGAYEGASESGIERAVLPRVLTLSQVGQVLRNTEGKAMPAECFGGEESNCAIVSCCQLKSVLAEAVDAFYSVLDRYTLADITRNKSALTSILHFHRPALA